jgi:hypothetical protein
MKEIYPYERGKKLCQYNSHKSCGVAKWVVRVPHKNFKFTHRYLCEQHAHNYLKRAQKLTESQKEHFGWPKTTRDFGIGILP